MAPTLDPRMDPRRAPAGFSGTEDLADRIEARIAGKARVRDLHVVCTDDLIILQGRTRTQHDKQLAQEAAFDVPHGQARLTNQIVVAW